MRISDSNKLVGSIMEVKSGKDMTEVIMDIGDQAITATVSSSAAKDMELKKGDQVFAVFNSTNVSLIKG
ncbi:MAG: TOBE domain-containing protein [Syntrophomonadaceae bacterium]|nr:TOBE domain-containing protein [Syntrophomonadaceae bacterium]